MSDFKKLQKILYAMDITIFGSMPKYVESWHASYNGVRILIYDNPLKIDIGTKLTNLVGVDAKYWPAGCVASCNLFELSDNDVDDLVAYIIKLKAEHLAKEPLEVQERLENFRKVIREEEKVNDSN